MRYYKVVQVELKVYVFIVQGAISLKLLGGKLAPKLVYIVLGKELLKL